MWRRSNTYLAACEFIFSSSWSYQLNLCKNMMRIANSLPKVYGFELADFEMRRNLFNSWNGMQTSWAFLDIRINWYKLIHYIHNIHASGLSDYLSNRCYLFAEISGFMEKPHGKPNRLVLFVHCNTRRTGHFSHRFAVRIEHGKV